MKHTFLKTLTFALFVAGTLSSPVYAKGVSGAIFTTMMDGSVVNGNQFLSKCDVYLDGGPGPNAPAKAAGLPDGDYYFQVTDPSGATLLSTDDVENRRFTVTSGVISGHPGTHPTGTDLDHGAVTISLADVSCPTDFLDTPNNGGVYKVWATPVADYVADEASCGGGCFHGFVASKSKTDNFKAQPAPATPTFCLTLTKIFRDEVGVEDPRPDWQIEVIDPARTATTHVTGADGTVKDCSLTEGPYTVSEIQEPGTKVVGLIVNGVNYPAEPTYSFNWDSTKGDFEITFINTPEEDNPPPGIM